jgi:hypothetical protein
MRDELISKEKKYQFNARLRRQKIPQEMSARAGLLAVLTSCIL